MLNPQKQAQTRVTTNQTKPDKCVCICRYMNWPLKRVRVRPLNIFRVGGTEHEGLSILF